jgi:N-glycosylase/DNA lyase
MNQVPSLATQEMLERAVIQVAAAIAESRCERWQDLSEEDLWLELAACILGSRVRYEVAQAAAIALRDAQLLPPKCLSEDGDWERQALCVLSDPLNGTASAGLKYPFPRSRARYLGLSVSSLGCDLKSLLHRGEDAYEMRRVLARNVAGIGPKQSSLFLRNIGYTEDLAILDSHVVQFMSAVRLVTYGTATAIDSLHKYSAIEELFRVYSESIRYSVGRTDVAVWIVMRVASTNGML